MGELRRVRPHLFPDVTPRPIGGAAPEVLVVDPCELMVDERYQRDLSRRSRRLIRRIYTEWDWRAFKPPIVTRVDGRLHVLDGQHTAIAAASRPEIGTIPVLVVDTDVAQDRAAAFVRHNRDRVQVTPMQMHFALVAAGDEDALTVAQACERAGAVVLKHPPSSGSYGPGETVAVNAMRRVLGRRFAKGLRRVLQVCVEARLAPITANAIAAVEGLLFDAEFAGEFDEGDIATALRGDWPAIERAAAAFAAEHRVPVGRALAVVVARRLAARGRR